MGIRVERTRAGKTWTEARYWAFIRSALRGAWAKYPVKHGVKKAVRRETGRGNSHRYEYPCSTCEEWFPDKEVQVDHIRPAGSLRSYNDLPRFVENLFCEEDNLQVLCKPCHQIKTNEEREEKNVKRKQKEKDK